MSCLDCVVCGKWPERDRCALREMIESLPLQETEGVCDEWVWSSKVGFPVGDDGDATNQ
jgi:hypothetical protein